MAEITVKLLVEGGKASANQSLAQPLAPHKINIAEIVKQINEKTKQFTGIEVPVEIIADTDTKEFEINVGTPSVSAMIKKELGLKKLARAAFGTYTPKEGETVEEFSGNLTFDQIVTISKAKIENMNTADFKMIVKQIVSSCVSNGCTIEEKHPRDILKEIDEGKWDSKINC